MLWPKSKKPKSKVELLADQIERGDWLREIEQTRGYQLILTLVRENLAFLLKELENCEPDSLPQLQADIKAMRTLDYALRNWQEEGKKARQILTGRAEPEKLAVLTQAQPNVN